MGIATAVDDTLTVALNDYVTRYSAALCDALQPIAVATVTIYLLFQGWAIARGHTTDTLPTLLMRAFRIAFIASIALVGGTYQDLVTGTIVGIQNALIQALSTSPNMGAFLDNVYEPYLALGSRLMTQGTTGFFPIWGLICASLLAMGAGIITLILGLGYYILAKVALTLLFAVGPVFILCAMFPSTQRFAESWLGQTLNYVMLSVLVAAAIGMVTQFGSEQARRILANPDMSNVLMSVAVLDIAVGGLLIVLLNLNNIATALTGGITLSGVGREVAGLTMRILGPSAARGMAMGRSAPPAGGAIGYGGPGAALPALPRTPLYARAVQQYAQRSTTSGG